MDYAKTVTTRTTGKTHDLADGTNGPPLGWFRTRENPAGWAMYAPHPWDIAWFNSKNESLNRVYRLVSDRGHTTLVKFTKKHGTVFFFDNGIYEGTDLIIFECQGVPVTRLLFDRRPKHGKY